MAACRGCGAPIEWAVTEAGKAIPLDPEPCSDGNLELTGMTAVTDRGMAGPQVRNIGPPGLFPDDRVRRMPHHATCPDVKDFR